MIENEQQVIRTVKQVSKLNLAINDATRYDGTFAGYLMQECEYKDLVLQRDALVRKIAEYDARVNPDRKGGWFTTIYGHRFWTFDPRPQDIHIEDIAHALGMLCRFCGHTRSFYSVAQHSVLVSQVVHPRAARAGLLHDAAEAYLGDIIKPLKRFLGFYCEAEGRVMDAVCQRFGLDGRDVELWNEVKRGDNVLLSTEFRDIARCGARLSMPEEPPMTERITRPWGPRRSKREFLARFKELFPDGGEPK